MIHRYWVRSQRQVDSLNPRVVSPSTSGFTMIELLAVTALMSIVMSIALPSWNSFLNIRNLNAAQNRASGLMRQGQSSALQSRVTWEVGFRETNGILQAASYQANTLPSHNAWTSLGSGIYIDAAETTLAQSGGVYRVQFDHTGRISGQLGRLTFKGSLQNRDRRCVIVSTLLGVIRRGENRTTADSSNRYCY